MLESDHDGRWRLREQNGLAGRSEIRYGSESPGIYPTAALLFPEVGHVVVALSGVDFVDLDDVALRDFGKG